MASAIVRDEVKCCICLEIFKDPVSLPCGHNFCRSCITQTWKNQDDRESSCPECMRRYINRPVLQVNTRLRNIAEAFQHEANQPNITCTYCIDSPSAAIKSCLRCEASLCDRHLKVHSKSPEHVLCDPTADLESRKCTKHGKILEYYCQEESIGICESCKQQNKHRGHRIRTLKEESKKRKQKYQHTLEKLTKRREVAEKKIQSLQNHKVQVEGKARVVADKVALLFKKLRRQQDDLENQVLKDISNKKEQISGSLSQQVHQLEMRKDELSRKVSHMKDICGTADPLTMVWESDREDSRVYDKDNHEEEEFESNQDIVNVDETLVALKIRRELGDIVNNAMKSLLTLEELDICLDEDTAAYNVEVSRDLKVAFGLENDETDEKTPEEFDSYQVISSTEFHAGKHYWEVDISGDNNFRIGLCYSSIDREGLLSVIGNNDASWCFVHSANGFSFKHSNTEHGLSQETFIRRLGIYLDYEAGRISFYKVDDQIKHLHTFTAAFTEPLRAALRVGLDVWVRIRN
ncbi:E3 ubiquitin/ISG15 ligase TRIM25-like [Hyperolius riggenbachi]|uniref:E3 ubiquitin/ISG15 ligase TRIM25-like n=1 Tax=Hyperolius riggenbachi TaxID=752182 RepID=UPI0035A3812A